MTRIYKLSVQTPQSQEPSIRFQTKLCHLKPFFEQYADFNLSDRFKKSCFNRQKLRYDKRNKALFLKSLRYVLLELKHTPAEGQTCDDYRPAM